MENVRIPRMLFQNELRNYFSYNNYGELSSIWGTSRIVIVTGDNGKRYEGRFDHDKWNNGVIRLKIVK